MSHSIEQLTGRAAEVGALVDELLARMANMQEPDPDADPRVSTDDRLRELLAGLGRVRNAAEAASAQVMVALCEEAERLEAAQLAAGTLPSRSHCEFVPDEVGVVLGCTKTDASRRYGLALRVANHPLLARAWAQGALDGRKVQAITDELAALADPEATAGLGSADLAGLLQEITAAGIDHARTHTWTQTREWLRRRILAVAPEVADRRRRRAEADRAVQITPDDDGMSQLWALLPSVSARQIQQALTSAAHELGSDDERSMDQRRADLLVEWLLGPDHAPVVHLHLVSDRSRGDSPTLADDSEVVQASWLAGVGQLTQGQTDELIGSAGRVVAAAATSTPVQSGYRPSPSLERSVRARDVTCRFPGCRRASVGPGSGTDLDHTVPWPVGVTGPANLAVLCRRHHRLKHSAGWRVALLADASMRWTSPSGRIFTTQPWVGDARTGPLRE